MSTRTGYVSIIGRPNVGKSTLMNQLVGQKISITSNKQQTTRHSITGIYTEKQGQIIFLDTPGLHTQKKSALNKHLNRTAQSVLEVADLVIFILEACRLTPDDEMALTRLQNFENKVILVVNKVDLVPDKEKLLPFLQMAMARYPFVECVPLCANQYKQVESLKNTLFKYLPEQDYLYDEDEITTASRSFLAAEALREKLTRRLNQELPYALTVEIESFDVEEKIYRIHALIYVERESQKAIVIGKGGENLRDASTQARIDLEKLFGVKIFLKAWVKVKQGWSDDEKALNSLGYKALE